MAKSELRDFVQQATGQDHFRVEQDLGDGFVRLHTSEAERRQAAQDIQNVEAALIELLRNSKDAHASHIFVALSKEGSQRKITIIDDGVGIPEAMQERIFEPRVTSKLDTSHMDAWGLHGRGMALYSIAHNTESARVVNSEPDLGASIQIIADTERLSERREQSAFPTFTLGEDGNVAVRGPRNILRNSCEFAIEARDAVQLYVGSPAEIACTLWYYGQETLSEATRVFCTDFEQLPLIKRLATAEDPAAFARIAASLGLDLSERTARRIMDGQIQPCEPILERIEIVRDAPVMKSGSAQRTTPKKLSLTKADKEALIEGAKEAFDSVAANYYLESEVEPHVHVSGQKITISIPIVPTS